MQQRKYNEISDLPSCGECDKPAIDIEKLGDYSTKILKNAVKEVDKTLTQIPGLLGFSCPASDVEGVALWRKNVDSDREYYNGIKKKLQDEIRSRKGKQ